MKLLKTGVISEEIIHEMFKELNDFIFIDPKIPDVKKNYVNTKKLKITNEDSREKIIDLITGNAGKVRAGSPVTLCIQADG